MNQKLIFKELEVTKENLLAHFKNNSKRDLCETWESIAIALDAWRIEHEKELKVFDLTEQLSDMRWKGVKSYEDHTVQELLDQFWEECVENINPKTIDELAQYI